MFKQNKKILVEVQKKNKNMVCTFMPKNGMCTGKNKRQKVNIQPMVSCSML